MGSVLNDEAKEEVRNRIPLEDLIRDYSVALLPSGGGRLRALCPFHHEKTPSFYVNTERQFYHCFGCKEHGDIFTFVEKMDHVDFSEALEILARRAGVTLQRKGARGVPSGGKVLIFDALSLAEEFYHRILLDDPRGAPARKYLEGRKISQEMWKRFRLGYAPPEWEAFLRFCASKQIPLGVLEGSGLVRRREGGGGCYDYFRGRVMFPIWDAQKRTVGFGARTLGDDEPKYLNTPKTPVFEKGQVLYGLPQARPAIQREGRIAIMEGYTDVIMAHQEGFDHAVGSLGTAFTAENARRLRGLAPKVDLVFDGDWAGQNATERSLDLLVQEELDVRIFTVTTGKDPCDALLELGGAEFRRRLEAEAVGIFEFKWKRTVAQAEARGEGPGGIARALDEVLGLLAKHPNPVARKLHAKNLAERLGLGEDEVEARLRRHVRSAHSAPSGSGIGGSPAGGGIARTDRGPKVEEVLLECLLAEPERARERRAQVPPELWPFGPAAEASVPGEPLLSEGEGDADLRAALRSIALALDEELRRGALDVRRLLGAIDDGEGAKDALIRILARIDQDRSERGLGREYVWRSCLRELERKSLEQKSRFLERDMDQARKMGDDRQYRALAREHFDVLRLLKSPNAQDHGPSKRGSEAVQGSGEILRKGSPRDQEARG